MNTPSLFDEPAELPNKPEILDDTPLEWNEVAAALFLSWPRAQQLHYCQQRDLHSMLDASDECWQRFYQQRAASYRDDLAALRG